MSTKLEKGVKKKRKSFSSSFFLLYRMKENTQKKITERKFLARDAFFPLREIFIKFPFTILHRFSQLREVELVGSGRNQS